MTKYQHQVELVLVGKCGAELELLNLQKRLPILPGVQLDDLPNLDFDVEANLDFDVEALDPHLPFEVLVENLCCHRPHRLLQQEAGGAERASTPPTPSYVHEFAVDLGESGGKPHTSPYP